MLAFSRAFPKHLRDRAYLRMKLLGFITRPARAQFIPLNNLAHGYLMAAKTYQARSQVEFFSRHAVRMRYATPRR